MFSLKTILFAATAALAGVASAAPLVDAHAHADVDALLRRSPALAARGTPSIPIICADVLVKLDGILAEVRKSRFQDITQFPCD